MKKYFIIGACLVGMAMTNGYAQSRVSGMLTVSDNAGGRQELTLGLDPTGTAGIDNVLGEAERPPLPPTGIFDARFIGDEIGISIGEGLIVDYRAGGNDSKYTTIHEIKYQMNAGGTQITIAWNFPVGFILRLQDVILGSIIDIEASGTGSYVVTSPGVMNKLKITSIFDSGLPVELTAFSAIARSGCIELRWKTATEVNNAGFSVQRRNKGDAVKNNDWSVLGYIQGGGTSWTPREYSYFDKSAVARETYSYRLQQFDRDGAFKYSEEIDATIIPPCVFTLDQNYPNPFNPTTTIAFSLPYSAYATLKIFTLLGQEVASLNSGELPAGSYQRIWDASRIPSGTYYYRLQAGSYSETKMLILLR